MYFAGHVYFEQVGEPVAVAPGYLVYPIQGAFQFVALVPYQEVVALVPAQRPRRPREEEGDGNNRVVRARADDPVPMDMDL